MSPRPSLLQFGDDFGHQRLVAAGQARNAEHMDIVFDGHAGGFARRLEERPDVHVEAQVGERGGDDFGAAVVAVLSHLGHQDARPPAFGTGEFFGQRTRLLEFGIALAFRRVDARDGAAHSLVAPEDLFQRGRDLAQCGARAGCLYGQFQQVAFAGSRQRRSELPAPHPPPSRRVWRAPRPAAAAATRARPGCPPPARQRALRLLACTC